MPLGHSELNTISSFNHIPEDFEVRMIPYDVTRPQWVKYYLIL